MNLKKVKGAILALTVVLFLSMTATGCSLVSVNSEKDNEQVVAQIDGQDIKKSEFKNYMAYYSLYYKVNGQDMPTGTALEEFKKDILDSLVQIECMYVQGKKDGVKVDETQMKADATDALKSLKESVGEDKYNTILSDSGTDPDAFATFMQDFMVKNGYASECYKNYTEGLKKDSTPYTDSTVGKIGGEDVKRGLYDYYYIGQEVNAYLTTGAALGTDDAAVKTTNETIFNNIAMNQALLQYCEDNNITISDAEIKAEKETLSQSLSSVGLTGTSLSSYLENYYMTDKAFADYQNQEAKAAAASEAITAKFAEEATVSDNDIKKYYNENKDTFDTSTVSAEHILTEDKDLAQEIYNKAKDVTTKADFDKIMAEYKGNEQVKETTDLGAFNKKKMVEAFSKKAFEMDVNTVSKPVKTDFGYHVIFKYDENKVDVPTWEDEKDTITASLKDEKASEEYTKFSEKLLKEQKIEIDDTIKSALEIYMDKLKTDLNVTVYEKVI